MTSSKTAFRLVYVVNPAAGKGKFTAAAETAARESRADLFHKTEGVGECTDFIRKTCLSEPCTHFVVYGGDGTAGEAVTGIMQAGAGESARLSIIPAGSGNDFYRGISEIAVPPGADSIPLDLLHVNGRYALNVANVGFDCNVVAASEALRRYRLMKGSLSYICGVGATLIKKETFRARIHLGGIVRPGEDGEGEEMLSGEFLLCAVGNLPFYGGGFKAVAAASPTDGKMDVMIVKNVSRARFISLVGDYRRGTHINPETLAPYPKFASIVEYRRCTSLTLTGVSRVCTDGEITEADGMRAEIVPAAIRYVPMKQE